MREIVPNDILEQCFLNKSKYIDMIKTFNIGNWKELVDQLILRWKLWDIYALCVL